MTPPPRVRPVAVVPPVNTYPVIAAVAGAQDEEVVGHGDGGAAAEGEGGERGVEGGGDVGGGFLGGFPGLPFVDGAYAKGSAISFGDTYD